MLLDVVILSPQQIIFEGRARSVILPGEEGFFEITPLHKRIIAVYYPAWFMWMKNPFP